MINFLVTISDLNRILLPNKKKTLIYPLEVTYS